MSETERKNVVKKFVAQWSERGYEKGETHSFWLSFLRDVSGVSEPEKFLDDEPSIAVELLKLYQNQIYLQKEK